MGLKVISILATFFGIQSAFASSMIYVPENFKPATAKIVVAVHGCLQSPESMALGTGWNLLADRENLVIIYPQVPNGSNDLNCWNWFQPENQTPKSGQLANIRNEIGTWKNRLKIKKAPVFVTGISSGAATVAGLLACFPKDFAGGAIHSGPSYGLASSLGEGDLILKNGPEAGAARKGPCRPENFKKPIMVLHGTGDKVVNPSNVDRTISDFLGSMEPASTTNLEENQMKYQVKDYKEGNRLRGRVVTVEGLGHAWAGYAENTRNASLVGPKGKLPTQLPFFTHEGPSSTRLIFEFFKSVP